MILLLQNLLGETQMGVGNPQAVLHNVTSLTAVNLCLEQHPRVTLTSHPHGKGHGIVSYWLTANLIHYNSPSKL